MSVGRGVEGVCSCDCFRCCFVRSSVSQIELLSASEEGGIDFNTEHRPLLEW